MKTIKTTHNVTKNNIAAPKKKIGVNILMLCFGNYCRSPLAEGIFNQLSANLNADHHFQVDSAGLGDWHVGSLAHSIVRSNAMEHGIDLRHRARVFDKGNDPQWADVIYCMDNDIFKKVKQEIAKVYVKKLKLFRVCDRIKNMKYPDVPDPYETNDFEGTFQLISRNCQFLLHMHLDELKESRAKKTSG